MVFNSFILLHKMKFTGICQIHVNCKNEFVSMLQLASMHQRKYQNKKISHTIKDLIRKLYLPILWKGCQCFFLTSVLDWIESLDSFINSRNILHCERYLQNNIMAYWKYWSAICNIINLLISILSSDEFLRTYNIYTRWGY